MDDKTLFRKSFYARRDIIKQADRFIEAANSVNRSDYINKAIEFYNGYHASKGSEDYIADIVTNTLKAIITNSESRLSRMGFKQAVEISKLVYMLAPVIDLDKEYLDKLHIRCVEEVSKINGTIKFESNYDYSIEPQERGE
jgi:hypothetical protein